MSSNDRKNKPHTTPSRKVRRRTGKKQAGMRFQPRPLSVLFVLVLLSMVLVIALHGRGDASSSVKPLIDVPLSEEETEEVVYTQGVDVSNYQGEIDFEVLHEQGVQFAFIKATEGNAWVDQRFSQNWENASRCEGLRYGAYHFMSFRTSGKEQAANFISTVPKDKHALPPVVDIELYQEFIDSPPSQEHFEETLDPILEALEKEYGKTPILYTTAYVYDRYILGRYDNPIWIADHSLPRTLPDGTPWMFCQYTYEGQLDGYDGEEPYIDLDVFNGSPEELNKL
ncbi:MAG: glycosyl hydrolase family 25 [Clostridiales bacterium]|nr:glycosyl hydrolase family 25 [Clostridiales bacterium]